MKSLSLAGRMDTCIPVAEFLCCSPEMVMTLLIGCVVVAVQPPSRVQLFVTPGLQHARPLCPSPSPEVWPSSCPLHRWCHPATSSSGILFSCPQSFPASGTFPVSQLFLSGGQVLELQLQHQLFHLSRLYMTTGRTIALIIWNFVGRILREVSGSNSRYTLNRCWMNETGKSEINCLLLWPGRDIFLNQQKLIGNQL